MDIARLDPDGRAMRDIRGGRISIIFQEPMTALSPLHTIGNQIGEALALHRTSLGKGERREAVHRDAAAGGLPRSGRRPSTPIRSSSPAACASAR